MANISNQEFRRENQLPEYTRRDKDASESTKNSSESTKNSTSSCSTKLIKISAGWSRLQIFNIFPKLQEDIEQLATTNQITSFPPHVTLVGDVEVDPAEIPTISMNFEESFQVFGSIPCKFNREQGVSLLGMMIMTMLEENASGINLLLQNYTEMSNLVDVSSYHDVFCSWRIIMVLLILRVVL